MGVAVGGGVLVLVLGGVLFARVRGNGDSIYQGLSTGLLGGSTRPQRAQRAQQGSGMGSRDLFDNPFGTGDDGSQSIALQDFKQRA
jgi:hypothetical protein